MFPKNLAVAHFAAGDTKTVYAAPSGVGARVEITICATDPVAPILAHVRIKGHFVARALRTDYAKEPISLSYSLDNGADIVVSVENATADVYIGGEEYTLGACDTTADDLKIALEAKIRFVHNDLTQKIAFCKSGDGSFGGGCCPTTITLDRTAEYFFMRGF